MTSHSQRLPDRLEQGGVQGLHHVTLMAGDARRNNRFYTETLGLRRVKKTVNFDAPDVYHLYYADRTGSPGTVMTFFPFPDIAPGSPGVGEASRTAFSVPDGSLPFWRRRLEQAGAGAVADAEHFGNAALEFRGSEGEGLALVAVDADAREPWTGGGVDAEVGIRGFHGVALTLRSEEGTAEILDLMGYRRGETEGDATRFTMPGGNGAGTVDIVVDRRLPMARLGSGSVHHVAFAVADRAAQARVRAALAERGVGVTASIDRDYFYAIYFRTPGGVLFEVATNEPGFARDEDPDHLGEALKLPRQHEHLRGFLQDHLVPLDGGGPPS